MNNKQVEILKKKINKFADKKDIILWHNNVQAVLSYRFSRKYSDIRFDFRPIEFPSAYSSEIFIIAANNDVVVLIKRLSFELKKWWEVEPKHIYEQVTGEPPIFQLDWELIDMLPVSLIQPIFEPFQEYFGVAVDLPFMTVGVVSRIPHGIHNGKVIYLPNTSFLGPEWSWVINMQKARINGEAIPPRPEVLLGDRLKALSLYDGIEWEGAE